MIKTQQQQLVKQLLSCSSVFVLFFSPSVVPLKKKKPGKNPDVDTSFLPDREREVLYDQRIN